MYSSFSPPDGSFSFDDTFGFDLNELVEGTGPKGLSSNLGDSGSSCQENDHEGSGGLASNLELLEFPVPSYSMSLPIKPAVVGCIGEGVASKLSGQQHGRAASPRFGSYRDGTDGLQLEERLSLSRYTAFQPQNETSFIINSLAFEQTMAAEPADYGCQGAHRIRAGCEMHPRARFNGNERMQQTGPHMQRPFVGTGHHVLGAGIPRSHSVANSGLVPKGYHQVGTNENGPNSCAILVQTPSLPNRFDSASSPPSHILAKGFSPPAFSSMATGVYGPYAVPHHHLAHTTMAVANSGLLNSVPDSYGASSCFPIESERPLTAPPGLTEKSRCIYVGNLDPRVTEVHLRDMFSEAGPIEVAKIINDRNIYRAGFKYGFVEYKTSEAAETALMTLNGRIVYGSEIKVNWAYASISNDKEASLYHIFVGDLSQEVNDYVLAKSFSNYASFCEARIMWDFMTGRSRGFGFVAFKDRNDAELAIRTMTGRVVGGREIRCNWACYKNKEGPLGFDSVSNQTYPTNTTVYLGNLPMVITESEVYKLLRNANCNVSNVSSIKIQADKGFCFIRMNSHENAVQMIIELNGQTYKDKELRCFWGRDKQNLNEVYSNRPASPFVAVSKFSAHSFPSGTRR